uniref:Uncharacterized protein n=1 Tax=Rhizophagus irregularis (strain DAOM 181602 / DAOM 197198 / MUCL 43194) TaxID=747089 RepID=U9SUX5_RHIID
MIGIRSPQPYTKNANFQNSMMRLQRCKEHLFNMVTTGILAPWKSRKFSNQQITNYNNNNNNNNNKYAALPIESNDHLTVHMWGTICMTSDL